MKVSYTVYGLLEVYEEDGEVITCKHEFATEHARAVYYGLDRDDYKDYVFYEKEEEVEV